MGILDFLAQGGGNEDPNASHYSDVPMGYRLGLLGSILTAASQGQQANPGGFAMMAKLKEDAKEQRRQAHAMELASKYLDKRPDLKPLVESGAISIADIIKMDREDAKTQDERNWWKEQEDYKREHDPNAAWLKTFMGDTAPTTPAVITDTSPMQAPAVPGAAPAPAPDAGVPTPPASGAPAMPPVPDGRANNPVTARMRQVTGDNALTDSEAMYLFNTVRSPDDLRAAYNNILTHRTEAQKAQAEADKVAQAKAETAAKETKADNLQKAQQMTAVSSIDNMLTTLDKEGLPTAGLGSMFSMIPGTNSYNFARDLDSVRSFISFDKLQEMREQSKTGASGLGQVSNFEQRMLGSSQGALDQGMDEETLRKNLKTIKTKIIAFNTPSQEDPTKSVMTMDSEKLAANPTPEAAAAFDKKYGEGSSDLITGNTDSSGPTPEDLPQEEAPPAPEGVDENTWKYMTPEERALWQN